MKKIILSILIIVIVTIISMFIFISFVANSSVIDDNSTPWQYKDEQELTKAVNKTFVLHNGLFDISIWEKSYKELKPKLLDGVTYDKKITGFDVQTLFDITTGEKSGYLVEFEPSGHIVFQRNSDLISDFCFYPSAYKLLNIEKNKRYYFDGIVGEIDGVMTLIEDMAYYGTIFPIPKSGIKKPYYDYYRNEWIYNKI